MGLFDKVTGVLGSDSDSSETEQNDENIQTEVFDIPEWAVKDRVNVDKRADIIQEHYDVDESQARTIAQKLKDEMESTDGYSHSSIRRDLDSGVEIDGDLLEAIILTEMGSIEMLDRVNSYLEKNDSDQLYKLSGLDDDRTHPVTREAVEEINSRDGATLKEIARVLIEKAEKYEDEGGTPERMEHWVPHERFRFTIVPHVDF